MRTIVGVVDELRILPLLASGTEIVHALGLGRFQVGRSHECDYPSSVLTLPVCTRPMIGDGGSSAEIDRAVKERVSSALSIYEVDSGLLSSLRPTHVITQTQCEVCAVSLRDVEKALRDTTDADTQVISLAPYCLADVWADIERVATACGCPDRGTALVHALQQTVNSIRDRAAQASQRPSVAAIEWLEPLMAAGNWVPELVELAGGTNLFGKAGEHSPWMSWEELAAADPDILVVLPCGFDLVKTRAEMHWLTARPDWDALSAVRNGRVFLCDGNQYMNRSGPRLVESLQILAEIVHPELFPVFQAPGGGWEEFLNGSRA